MSPNIIRLAQSMGQNMIQVVKLQYRKGLLKRIVASKSTDISEELKKVNLKYVMMQKYEKNRNLSKSFELNL